MYVFERSFLEGFIHYFIINKKNKKSKEQNPQHGDGTEQTTGNINIKNYRNKCKKQRETTKKNEKLITY